MPASVTSLLRVSVTLAEMVRSELGSRQNVRSGTSAVGLVHPPNQSRSVSSRTPGDSTQKPLVQELGTPCRRGSAGEDGPCGSPCAALEQGRIPLPGELWRRAEPSSSSS